MASDDPGIVSGTPVASNGAYQVNFNGSDGGLVDLVDPTKIQLIFKDITTGTTGKENPIGLRFKGAKTVISVAFRQITLALQQLLCTWSSGVPVQLMPPLNADMYNYSFPLILHPTDRPTSDTTMDLVAPNAVCIKVPLTKRDGGDDDVAVVDFMCFPPRSQMNDSTGVMNVSSMSIKGT